MCLMFTRPFSIYMARANGGHGQGDTDMTIIKIGDLIEEDGIQGTVIRQDANYRSLIRTAKGGEMWFVNARCRMIARA